MIVAGVDYSITCPCISIYKEGQEPLFIFVTKKMKDAKVFRYGFGFFHDPSIANHENEMYRFHQNALVLVDNIITQKVDHVFIEGYSFASKGMVYNIGENCGIFKLRLLENNIPYTIVPPTVIKKYATGKGNSNKEAMYEAFVDQTNIDLELYGFKPHKNPSSDIVDSYFISKYGFDQLSK